MVPDSSPRASKGVLVLAWRLLSHFFARGPTFLDCISFRWVRASAPAGCSPRGLEGRLVSQRRAPKVPAGDLPDPVPFGRVRGLDASL
jgi:hypothetical protein